ncbi:PHP domain-containing protein [Conexibacter sp. CPCC 206217]|uniref:PHP domain-containing protein n=1 Tax=Conexibacter sp. CPCC 206217 TaxID=3064574 RepID=UPI00272050AB|nr:PHP domain-containing protein [Conexibacter sp. CPCC 206217]MDO8213770.1 PHP domain-containing protein [Conexibacter sp. CPCC 206217]
MTKPTFDLQSHSLHSDGVLPPADVVANAAAAGVKLLALSDHDTVDGVDEAIAAGIRHGVAIVPATEISSVDGRYEDLHILGYGIDHRDPQLAERLLDARADRELRAERMAAKLNELGFEVDDTLLAARRAQGKPIGRPHLAEAVLRHPANAARLEREGHDDVSSFIPAYLIPGTPGYLARTHPTVFEAIGWIHDAGGLAIWAHPYWDLDTDEEVIGALDRFAAAGIDGVEAFYPTHSEAQTRVVVQRANELRLLTTGSSDYHGPEHRLFRTFLAHDTYEYVPDLSQLEEAAASAAAQTGGVGS